MSIIEITDLSAPELSAYTKLTEAQLRNKRNPLDGLFIAESVKVIEHALNAGYEPVSFLMSRKHAEGKAAYILKNLPDIPVFVASNDILCKLTGYELTRGVLCAMKRKTANDPDSVCHTAKKVAVLENITDASNIGSIFRSAAALGFDAVLLSPSCCDPLHRKSIRVSMGTVFQIPWAYFPDEPAWPKSCADPLHSGGFFCIAMALSKDSVSLDDEKLKQHEKIAVFLGTEGTGLCEETIADCDQTVMIPMFHGADSLNVSSAATIAFWEFRNI